MDTEVTPQRRDARPRHALWSAARRDPVLRGLACFAAAASVLLLTAPGTGSLVILYWAAQPTLDVITLVLMWRLAKVPGLPATTARFWRVLTRATLLFTIGDTSQLVLTVRDPVLGQAAGGVLHNVLLGVGVCAVVVAMLTHPSGITGGQRIRFWIDATTVMIAAIVITGYFMLGDGTDTLNGSQVATLVVSASLMLVGSFAVVKLLMGGAAPFTRTGGVIGAITVVIIGATAAPPEWLINSSHLDLLLVVRVLPMVLFSVLPRMQEIELRVDPDALTPRRGGEYSRLPYVAVAATQALLVLDVVRGAERGLQVLTLLAGVVVVTALVVGRQLLAFHDNSRLLAELSRHERRFRSMVQHSGDVIALVDADLRFTYASPAVERILGVPPERVIGSAVGSQSHLESDEGLRAALVDLVARPGGTMEFELRFEHPVDRSIRWLHTVATNLLDDPSVRGIIFNSRDITQAKELTDRLRHQASHDPLTRLANRSLLTERMAAALAPGGRPVAICLVDLDDFKDVNDSYGHHVGDLLLVGVAERLRNCIRPGDTVARLGGDEFAVLLPDTTAEVAAGIVRRIMRAFADPLAIEGHQFTVEASVGLATGELEDADALLRAADAAMYSVKRTGKGGYEHTSVAS